MSEQDPFLPEAATNASGNLSRRRFILQAAAATTALAAMPALTNAMNGLPKKIRVGAHLWVYASKFPPDWDCTPELDQIFSDLSYAGMDGLELMEVLLRHDDAVPRLKALTEKYNLPVIGTSYSADMWDREQHRVIEDDVELVAARLHDAGGKTFGISVGSAGQKKTEQELDAQAEMLQKVSKICRQYKIVPNLHNHTYEVENELHDLKGTLQRLPDFKLGPDLNWLVRGGVDPVDFINTFHRNIVYLHLRDQHASGEWTEALGEGATDFDAIAAALHKTGFKGMATIELAYPENFTPTRPLKENWKISRELVRQKFGW